MDFLIVNNCRPWLRQRKRANLPVCLALDAITLCIVLFAIWWFHGAYFG